MDYKQEAERLIELFLPHAFDRVMNGVKGHSTKMELKHAKACAAICVQEIIKALGGDNYPAGSSVVPREIINYNKVLEHIKQQ